MMKTTEIVEKLGLKVFSGAHGLDREIKGCYVSDLLSDVMGNADADYLWITLQTHKNVMAVASLKDLAGVILVSGLEPEPDVIQQSDEEGIPILGTDLPTFQIAGKIFELIR